MALDSFKNFAKVTVSTGYDASATSIVLSAGHGARLPSPPCNLTYWNDTDYPDPSDDPNVEIVRVTAIVSDTLTVTRAQESTAASTKNTSAKTYRMIAGLTAKSLNTDLASLSPQCNHGRLTLASGEPVIATVDVTGATTIYYSPYKGNMISLYDGSAWVTHTFSELSIPLGTLVNNTNYDVFMYSNAGVATLEMGTAWASASARTNALAFQNGIYVKSGTPTRRYLGTFRTTSTTTTEDSQTKRLLWNVENQVVRRAYKEDPATHAYTGGWRIFNGDATNKIDLVVGLPVVANIAFSAQTSPTPGSASYVAIGINQLDISGSFYFANGLGQLGGLFGMGWLLDLGYSEMNIIENSAAAACGFLGASVSVTLLT